MRVSGRAFTLGLALLLGAPGVAGLVAPGLLPGVDRGAAIVLCVGALLTGAMCLTNRDPMGIDVASPPVARRYLLEGGMAMLAYVLALAGSLWLLKRVDPMPLRAAVALLPLLPILAALLAMARYLRSLDELQQRIELVSLAVASGLVSLLYMAGGLLQSARLIEIAARDAMIWVFPLICAVYGVGRGVVARRYE